jgi:hypothetical protein
VSRTKVFGTGHALPLDRNAKVRIEVYGLARCRQAGCSGYRCAACFAGGVPQQPQRRLLPILRIDSRQGRLRP